MLISANELVLVIMSSVHVGPRPLEAVLLLSCVLLLFVLLCFILLYK